MIRSRGLDSTDAKVRAANDIDNGPDGLAAWARGERNFENTPNSEFVRGVGSDFGSAPRLIPANGPALTDADKQDIANGRALLAYEHNAVLDDRDKELVQSGKAVIKPMPIPADRAGSLTPDELRKISTGEATLVPSSAPAPTEFRKGADGRLQIPQDRLHEALDRGACSIEDIASGKVQIG